MRLTGGSSNCFLFSQGLVPPPCTRSRQAVLYIYIYIYKRLPRSLRLLHLLQLARLWGTKSLSATTGGTRRLGMRWRLAARMRQEYLRPVPFGNCPARDTEIPPSRRGSSKRTRGRYSRKVLRSDALLAHNGQHRPAATKRGEVAGRFGDATHHP